MADKRLDPAIPLTAAGAIFGALVGTTLLDTSSSVPAMRVFDRATQALWIPVFLLFALLAAWPDSRRLRLSAWIFASVAAFITAGVIFFTTFGFTRDTDQVLLRVDRTTKDALVHVCGRQIGNPLRGTIRTQSLGTEFVIFDFAQKTGGRCKTVDIPRSGVLAFQEVH
jgi:hypothetical protein